MPVITPRTKRPDKDQIVTIAPGLVAPTLSSKIKYFFDHHQMFVENCEVTPVHQTIEADTTSLTPSICSRSTAFPTSIKASEEKTVTVTRGGFKFIFEEKNIIKSIWLLELNFPNERSFNRALQLITILTQRNKGNFFICWLASKYETTDYSALTISFFLFPFESGVLFKENIMFWMTRLSMLISINNIPIVKPTFPKLQAQGDSGFGFFSIRSYRDSETGNVFKINQAIESALRESEYPFNFLGNSKSEVDFLICDSKLTEHQDLFKRYQAQLLADKKSAIKEWAKSVSLVAPLDRTLCDSDTTYFDRPMPDSCSIPATSIIDPSAQPDRLYKRSTRKTSSCLTGFIPYQTLQTFMQTPMQTTVDLTKQKSSSETSERSDTITLPGSLPPYPSPFLSNEDMITTIRRASTPSFHASSEDALRVINRPKLSSSPVEIIVPGTLPSCLQRVPDPSQKDIATTDLPPPAAVIPITALPTKPSITQPSANLASGRKSAFRLLSTRHASKHKPEVTTSPIAQAPKVEIKELPAIDRTSNLAPPRARKSFCPEIIAVSRLGIKIK